MNNLVSDLRARFLSFFASRDHKVMNSAPLIPQNDPSLLFVNAGMAPLKEYFLGQTVPPHTNLVSCQKCIRAGGKHNDLDQVGYTKRHHTFFEMCGNFSFGGYKQEEAIKFAWEFLTEELKLDKAKLWVTVHPDDAISYQVWSRIVDPARIVRLGENEWSMGGDGPCGMCTEIFYDHGSHIEGTIEEGDRFVEIWNVVFMTHQVKNGIKSELPKICIDTGMGLERIAAVMSGTEDNYAAPLFKQIIDKMGILTGKELSSDFRIIADHARAAVFAIADGILPDVSSRGYVIRKIIRRALIHEYPYKTDLLRVAANYMIEEMGFDYPELIEYKNLINTVLSDERKATAGILDNAWELVSKTIKQMEIGSMVPGEKLFFLHDTHGIPIEVTCSILEQLKLVPDLDGYNRCVQSNKVTQSNTLPVSEVNSSFVGYDSLESHATLLEQSIARENRIFVFDSTPFYAESGGQESDHGYIYSDSTSIKVSSVKKVGNSILHVCSLGDSQELEVGSKYRLVVDPIRRSGLRKHHSATHLLLASLRKHLGSHVIQKGSLVRQDSLRFDFLHNSPIDKDTLSRIEAEVNHVILSSHASSVEELNKQEAQQKGAVATFGEKYGERVRVVSIGPSIEFCGGTHVENSSEVGSFYILKEKGVAGGVRRIEAIAGEAAYEYARSQIDLVRRLATGLRVQENVLEQAVLKKDAKQTLASESELNHINVSGHKGVLCFCQGYHQGQMLKLTDEHIEGNDLVLVCSVGDSKSSLILKTTELNANDILKALLNKLGGHGGGKPNLSQGGVQRFVTKEELTKCLAEVLSDLGPR